MKDPQVDLEEEERIRKRQSGIQVTPESFAMWKRVFDAERIALRSSEAAAAAADLRVKDNFLINCFNLKEI